MLPAAPAAAAALVPRTWCDGLIDGCCKGEPKGKKRRAPKQPPPGQTLPTDMDHRLRWRDCLWRMGGQDVMRLCSTSGRYVTSLEIRHFQGNLGDESGRAMISSAWEVGSQLSSRPNGWQPQYLNPSSLFTEDHRRGGRMPNLCT